MKRNHLNRHAWQESPGMSWFWEVWDGDDPEGGPLESGIAESKEEALKDAKAAAQRLRRQRKKGNHV